MPQPLDSALRRELLSEALNDLSAQRTVTLMTYPVGQPYPRLRGMGFVNDGWVLYMSTRRAGVKAREIASNPAVSAVFWLPQRRFDHFVQIDLRAVEVTGASFDDWQNRRYEKEGEGLRRVAARMPEGEWIGWRLDPVRVRTNGYVLEGPWRETPLVYRQAELAISAT